MFLVQNFLGIPNMSFVFLYDAWNVEKSEAKNDVINFTLYITNTCFIWNVGFVCGNYLLIQSNHKVV